MDVLLGGYSESLSTTKHFEFQLHCLPCVYADKWICISKKVCVCLGQRWSPGLILVGLVSLRIQIRCLYLIPRNIFLEYRTRRNKWHKDICSSFDVLCSVLFCRAVRIHVLHALVLVHVDISFCTSTCNLLIALAQRSSFPCISPGAFQVHTLLNSLWSISDTEIRVTVLSRAWLVSYWNYTRL